VEFCEGGREAPRVFGKISAPEAHLHVKEGAREKTKALVLIQSEPIELRFLRVAWLFGRQSGDKSNLGDNSRECFGFSLRPAATLQMSGHPRM
jgi:hypothetical protein